MIAITDGNPSVAINDGSGCLCACVPVCLRSREPVCLCACVPVCLRACVPVCM